MFLEIVAGLFGSQVIRAVAFDVATSLLCQIIQQTVTTAAKPRTGGGVSQTDAGSSQTDADAAETDVWAVAVSRPIATETTVPHLRALSKVKVVSSVAGRARLRVPGVRDDAACAAEIAATVRALDGVTSAQANPLTGTLLVHFDPHQVSVAAIVAALEAPLPSRPRAAQGVPYLRLVVG